MTVLRAGGLARLALALCLVIYALHFLSATFSPSDAYAGDEQGSNWGERLGLDHYAEFEQGVSDRFGKVKDHIGSWKGGISWTSSSWKLGNLYDLIAASNPSPGPAYYDERSKMDIVKLSSTRVLGHGSEDEAVDNADDRSSSSRSNRRLPTRRHILITGGFGSIGKHVVRDLLLGSSAVDSASSDDNWPDPSASRSSDDEPMITILDVQDRRDELNFLLQQSADLRQPLKVKGADPRGSKFSSSERTVQAFVDSGRLRIVTGDVRDANFMATMLAASSQSATRLAMAGSDSSRGKRPTTSIPPISGIIHLASYGPSLCRQNPVDCEDVETQGMKAILGALTREGLDHAATAQTKAVSADRPWIVVPRRGDVWNETGKLEGAAVTDSRVSAIELLKRFSTQHPLHSVVLTLPSEHSIIGDPFVPRFSPIASIVQAALADLPIQAFEDVLPPANTFLGIDEVSKAIVQSARMLAVAYTKTYVRELAFVAELGLEGPEPSHSRSMTELVELVVHLTGSQSAFARIRGDEDEDDGAGRGDTSLIATRRKVASKALGFVPSATLRDNLRIYIASVLKLHSDHLTKKISVACSTPPSIPVLEEALLGLSGCNVQLLTLAEGAFRTLGCSEGIDTKVPTPLALTHAVPYKEGVRGVEIFAERGLEGKVDLQFRCPQMVDGNFTGESELILWGDNADGGEFIESSKPDIVPIAEWFTVDFAHRDSRSFTLTLPPTEGMEDGEEPKRRLMYKDQHASRRQLIFQPPSSDTRTLTWKINPICCPHNEKRKVLWDFFRDDPLITSQVEYPSFDGRTSMSDSTHSLQRCQGLRADHERLTKIMQDLAKSSSRGVCKHKRGEADGWSIKELPICQNDCSAPLVCIASKKCRCASDRCGNLRANAPFPAYLDSNKVTFPLPTTVEVPTIKERVEAVSWDSLILPAARRWFNKDVDDLPRGHVIDIPRTVDTHLDSPSCYQLDKAPLPFMGDHFMIEAIRSKGVSADEADFALVPFYQGCYYNYLQQNTFHKLADTVAAAEPALAAMSQITPSRIAVPFTHDFGSCTGWWPRLEEVLPRSPPSPMDKAISWQPNGEYNTRCYKPGKDVVTPAVSKHTRALLATFSDVTKVTPVTSRTHLAFFAGGVRGFGAIVRTRIGCERTAQPAESPILYQQFAPGQRYLGTLNSAKFCLLPRGIPAWTTRTFEAIYAGCIPAFIADRNAFPFEDILDYSKFSVTIPEVDAHKVEDILKAYTEDQLVKLQTNLLRVREAFVYDEGHEWERRGPLYFTLLSMAMRLPQTKGYPQVGSCAM